MPLRWFRLAVGSVHALTAAGAAAALFALIAIAEDRIGIALIWMAIGQVIDGVDGPLARRLRVAERCPSVDGALLDNLVDYVGYVIVPAFLVKRAIPLPGDLALPAALAITVVSAFQFAQTDAKSEDGSFRGFPSYWNLTAFYLLLLGWPEWVNAAVIGALCVLVFVPIRYVHPVRTASLRGLTLGLTVLWAILLVYLLFEYPGHRPGLVRLSLVYVAYYVGLSLRLTALRRGIRRRRLR